MPDLSGLMRGIRFLGVLQYDIIARTPGRSRVMASTRTRAHTHDVYLFFRSHAKLIRESCSSSFFDHLYAATVTYSFASYRPLTKPWYQKLLVIRGMGCAA
jgi:hypothetical protein